MSHFPKYLHLSWCFLTKSINRARHSTGARHLHFNPPSMSPCLSTLLNSWICKFQENSIPDPDSSAEFIIAHVKGLKTLHNVDTFSTTLNRDEVKTINRLCQLRLERVPVQYIIKEWDFRALTLKMRPPTLIPRPESEEFVDHCMSSFETLTGSEGHPAFVEIGCGSGAVSLALLHESKHVRAVALDISPEACELTLENANFIGVEKRLKVVEGDIKDDAVLSELRNNGPFNVLVSNPPYLNSSELPSLQPEISRFEDHRALFGGPDGLDLTTHILKKASSLVLPHGDVWIQVAPHQPQIIQQMADSKSFHNLKYVKTVIDMLGWERFCHLQVTS